jgi:hypothetical protein
VSAAAVACRVCADARRASLGEATGPRGALLALPGCACQTLPSAERRKRLLVPGAGPLAELSTRYFAEVRQWVAVAKGADVRALGAAADVALGLGSGWRRCDAVARATGEMLERYGAALVPPGSGERVALTDWRGLPCGDGPAAAAWLPFHRDGRPVLPANSAGLGFAFDRKRACRAAVQEMIERRAIDALARGGLHRAQALGPVRIGVVSGHGFRIAATLPVALVLIADGRGHIVAAGAAARHRVDAALIAARREAALGWLVAQDRVLPGAGLRGAGLLGPLADLPLSEWPVTGRCGDPIPPKRGVLIRRFGFADLTPGDIAAAGGWVVRAMERTAVHG